MICLDDKKHAELMMHIGALIDIAEKAKQPAVSGQIEEVEIKIQEILMPTNNEVWNKLT